MRIGIIGAGFSGMLAAYLLEKKGYDITVYEKQEILGGHCRTLSIGKQCIELGTAFSFNESIRTLLLELDIQFSERFTYRNFVNEQYTRVEQLSRQEVASLVEELSRLEKILAKYMPELGDRDYGYIHEDLLIPLYDFLRLYDLHVINDVIAPHLSSYGFGSLKETQAYYAFNVFNLETIQAFIRGDKFLFVDAGFSALIEKLAANIDDIRYGMEAISIERQEDKILVKTPYGDDFYDKVLVTSKLPKNLIQDEAYNAFMQKIDTKPYFICAYEVANKNIVTTYFKSHLGQKGKIQFFHAYPQQDKSIILAYAYGYTSAEAVKKIALDIEKTGIHIKHLITTKQWHIFPHVKAENLTQSFYQDLAKMQKSSPICLIGSLISKPSISNLYESVRNFVEAL